MDPLTRLETDTKNAGDEILIPTNTSNPIVDEETIDVISTRLAQMKISIVILAVIALVSAMYLAQAFFLPLLIGILASYTLSPLVDFLEKFYIPRTVAAALILTVVVCGIIWLGLAMSNQANEMIEKLPDATRKLRLHLSNIRTPNKNTLQNIQETAKQLEGVAADASIKNEAQDASNQTGQFGTWLHDYALKQSLLIFSVVAQAPIVLLLTYFLLASGEHFRRKIVQFAGPSFSRKKDVVHILDEINNQIQLYLMSMLIASILVGLSVWLAFKLLGMEEAGLWGVIAGILQFIPYLGPAITTIASGIASYLQFGTLLGALSTVSAVLLITAAIGLAFTTWLQSRFAHINTAVLFISLLFFAWLWGICGLLLGAPLVAIIKVICDRIESLKPFGDLLGR